MAKLFMTRVINCTNGTTFSSVPKMLKAKVAELLLAGGYAELVPAEYGGTAPNEE